MNSFNVSDYLREAKELEKLFFTFISLCSSEGYIRLTNDAKPYQRELLKRYEIWFSVVKLICRQYSESHNIFEETYFDVKNHILVNVDEKKDLFQNRFIDALDEQVNILHTIIPIISLRETNFKKIITGDLLNSELEQAELLYEREYQRAAGAIAGVVLERYLKTLCEVNQIPIGGNDTIEPLATKLYKSTKLPDFDLTLFKSIQYLASIRNKCTHPKEEIKNQEIRELIDKTKKITFLAL